LLLTLHKEINIVSRILPKRIKGIITADGTLVKVDKLNSDGTTVAIYLPAPDWSGIDE